MGAFFGAPLVDSDAQMALLLGLTRQPSVHGGDSMLTWFFRLIGLFGAFTAVLAAAASPAAAHPAGLALGGWTAGFDHPLHGWDHFIVMVAVGLWAAQQAGRARWVIPATFVSIMAVGGVVGESGLKIPGVEAMILISVISLAALVLLRARLPLGLSIGVAALFAFFHGFAHGQEIPDAASLASFGPGSWPRPRFCTAWAMPWGAPRLRC